MDYFVEQIYPLPRNYPIGAGQETKNINIIASIGGWTIKHYTKLIQRLNELELAVIELNISCPNVANPWAINPNELIKLFSFCRAGSRHPLIVKIGPEGDFRTTARYAQYCEINAISAINTQPAAKINSKNEVFLGGLSGKSLKPVALRVIIELRRAGITLPIIGGGGIYSWRDCQEFFAAGADAISFGSVFLEKPLRPTFIVRKHKNRA